MKELFGVRGPIRQGFKQIEGRDSRRLCREGTAQGPAHTPAAPVGARAGTGQAGSVT